MGNCNCMEDMAGEPPPIDNLKIDALDKKLHAAILTRVGASKKPPPKTFAAIVTHFYPASSYFALSRSLK